MYSRVYVEITNICNLRCSFCHGHSRAPRRMTAQEFSCVLDRLEGVTNHVYYHLMGEPLLHPELPNFIRLANARNFRSVITTNGTLLDRAGQELIASAPHKVSISLHSSEGESNGAHVHYMQKVIEFADAASRAGIIVVLRMWNRGFDGGKNEEIFARLQEFFKGEWVENTRGVRIRDKLHVEWGDRFAWPDKDIPSLGDEVFCYGLKDHFGILCDGTVVPCCLDSDGVIALGNVFEQPLADILSSPRAKAMVDGFTARSATEELCRRCGYARRFV